MNDAIVTEYVELCERLAALEEEETIRLYARLDELWYVLMTESDQAEAERRLSNERCSENP